ncbi:MAG TPA: type II toxin-antitoxin system RelE/ParE family toxin [Blastocatellia bacterium]
MTAIRGFDLHPEAARDITEIWEFIAADDPRAANRVREGLLDAIRNLAIFPYLGHSRADLTSRPLRFCNVGNYLIAYAPDEEPLLVVAVVHGRRSPRVIKALLRRRK